MNDLWNSRLTARIMGWNGKEEHRSIEAWVKSIPGAEFDTARGISYINGEIYHYDMVFATEEDLLACKLKFGSMVA
jgi:hypothetical protein